MNTVLMNSIQRVDQGRVDQPITRVPLQGKSDQWQYVERFPHGWITFAR